ncbi:MAG: hypothetical protein C5B58_04495, partial [Acidobacteria bacterium]
TNIPGGSIRHVYSPKRKGQGKAGIARPGLVVTSEGLTLGALGRDPKFSLFQGIAHEIAHYWWNFGAGQGDWINEAFAEYFSAVAVEKCSSQREFRIVLDDYRKEANALPADAPPLATVPPMDPAVLSSAITRALLCSILCDTHSEMRTSSNPVGNSSRLTPERQPELRSFVASGKRNCPIIATWSTAGWTRLEDCPIAMQNKATP